MLRSPASMMGTSQFAESLSRCAERCSSKVFLRSMFVTSPVTWLNPSVGTYARMNIKCSKMAVITLPSVSRHPMFFRISFGRIREKMAVPYSPLLGVAGL